MEVQVPDLSIVIVSWNNLSYLKPCLDSIYQSGDKIQFDIVIVDNGSEDGSQQMLRESFPAVQVIQNERNMGLSRASNQGIRATQGRYVLLYNNDTIMQPGTLDKFVEFMDAHPDAGAAGGRLVNGDGSFQASYNPFPGLWREFINTTRLALIGNPVYPSLPDTVEARPVDWLSSACLAIRRTALDQIGLLDEQYFIYGDEMELQYRLKQAGWKVYFIPEITTVHFGSVSLNRLRRRRLYYRGVILFFSLHRGKLQTSILRAILSLAAALKIIYWSAAGLFRPDKQTIKAEIASNVSVLRMCLQPVQEVRAEFDPILQGGFGED